MTGNEIHYLTECENRILVRARAPIFKHFQSKYPNFDEHNPKQKSGLLLGCEDNQFCSLIHEVCHECFPMPN